MVNRLINKDLSIAWVIANGLLVTYHRVLTYVVYGGRLLSSRARPKSAILTESPDTSRFSGFMSRCIIPLECIC